MSLSTTATADDLVRTSRLSGSFADNPKTVKSAVAWHAFAAGAAAASSLSLILPTLTCRVPFDSLRASYATAVRSGLIKDSLLGNAKFERDLSMIEKIALGSWARCV